MLKSLNINNFAIIDKVSLEFSRGLNIITGETGAGKSIIVDALMLALGDRASIDMIRQGEQKAIIEGVFSIEGWNNIKNLLLSQDIDLNDDEIIIRREVNIKGNSRCFINDSPVPVNTLKQIGDLLVDFHGQHDHQQLLKPEYHIGILDSFARIDELLKSYSFAYSDLSKTIREYSSMVSREKNLRDKEESQKYELNEILRVNPQDDEEAILEQELQILENSETLLQLSGEAFEQLSEMEGSVYTILTQVKKTIEHLSKIDAKFTDFNEECNSALISIGEISSFIDDYRSNIRFEPERIEEVRIRLLTLKGLRKKYGSFEAIFERIEFLKSELGLIENFEDAIEKIKEHIQTQKDTLANLAVQITEKRKDSAENLETAIIKSLKNLGIENAVFRVIMNHEVVENNKSSDIFKSLAVKIGDKEVKAFENGVDIVEFFISTNKGEVPMPLAAIASGGEISRVMLAIKSILAETDELPMLVFDEIDSGISGRIAQKVGYTMKNLASSHQIIAITHLPQIAALGDLNITVSKHETGGRTTIQAKPLNIETKVMEVARLLSGEHITDAAISSARELIGILVE